MKTASNLSLLLLLGLHLISCNNRQSEENRGTTLPADTLVAFQPDWELIANGSVNLSSLLEKPAGRDGFLHLKDGHFFTPSGDRFRIWGVNLTAGACYPEKNDAVKVAQMLSAIGVNAVRFHFLDANWGADRTIFRSDTNTTRMLSETQLDKLDYFVSELKKEGIYSNFNLNVGRNFREGDQVPFHQYLGLAKGVTLFDDRIIELQKEYAMQLLTHVNSYTGNEYRNEPALAFLEIVNENSLVEAWFRGHLEGTHNSTNTSTWIDIPKYYSDKLTEKYNQWLKINLTSNELKSLYKKIGIPPGTMIPRLNINQFKNADKERFAAEARFIMETEDAFYSGIYHYLKDSVKVNQFIAANSDHNHWKSGYALLSATSKLDFVDGHVYWQHPNYFTDKQTGKQTFSIENSPMVNDPFRSTVAQLSRSAVQGKPYTISEINHPYPNEFACEGIVILGAYALHQDWDGIYFYTFEHDAPSVWKTKTPRYFDILHDPVKLCNLAAASLMFHRGDVSSAETTILRNYSESDLIEGIRTNIAEMPFFTPGFDPSTPVIYKTRISSFSGGINNFSVKEISGPITSESGQLSWYSGEKAGLVVIDTEKTQSFTGFSSEMATASTKNLSVKINNSFSSILLTSLDGKEIERAENMVLTASSASVLSGAQWNSERTSMVEWGTLPFMIQPVSGSITLSNLIGARKLKVTPLDASGNPLDPLPEIRIKKGTAEFTIGTAPTVWYIIEVK